MSNNLLSFYSGSDMTCPDFSGTSPFHLAIQEEALKCLSQCLRFLPKEILEIPDSQFRLPLHHAVQVGSIEACQVCSYSSSSSLSLSISLSISLSLVPYGNRGCSGGSRLSSLLYVIDNGGLDTEETYPYYARVSIDHTN